MKLQTIACAVAFATGGLFFTHVINEATAATNAESVVQSVQPTQAQKLVTRQLATLVDRQHYLNMRLDANTSNRILDFYLDSLDGLPLTAVVLIVLNRLDGRNGLTARMERSGMSH